MLWLIACLLLLCVPVAQGATLLVVPSGGATTGPCTSTACTPARALAIAVAGDVVTLADGTYPGPFAPTNSGTSGNPITLQATNQHQAILTGTNTCSGTNAVLNLTNKSWWTFQDLVVRDTQRGFYLEGSTGITLRRNILTNFHADAIALSLATTGTTITQNVIGFGDACVGGNDNAGIHSFQSHNATIRENIIVATGNNNGTIGTGPTPEGYCAFMHGSNNIFQGNMCLANLGRGVFRTFADATSGGSDDNVDQDNMFLWGQGGFGSDDCADHRTDVINNLVVGVYHSSWSTKGNIDGARGSHTVRHNTFVMTDFTRQGISLLGAGCAGAGRNYKTNNTFQDNVIYSTGTTNIGSGERWLFHAGAQGSSPSTLATNSHNLFWGPSGTGTWVSYTYAGTDIHAAGSQPLFTNAATGNYTLASGSPGFNAASDATSMGIAWNTYLKQAWAAHAFGLATQETTGLTAATSTSFPVTAGRAYTLHFYIPQGAGISSCVQTAEQFTIEGATTTRDIQMYADNDRNGTADSIWITNNGTARYINLGRYTAADNTLNVAWQNAGCVERVFVRALPTVQEAFAWIFPAASAPPTATITAPTSGTTHSTSVSPMTDLAGSPVGATDDVGVTSVTWACPTCTPTSGTATCGTCGAAATSVAWSVGSIGLAPGDNVITVTANDADTQTGSDQLTVTYTPPAASTGAPFRLVR